MSSYYILAFRSLILLNRPVSIQSVIHQIIKAEVTFIDKSVESIEHQNFNQ